MPSSSALLWINKTAKSSHLSRSEDQERIQVFSQAQRTSRPRKSKQRDQTQERLRTEKRRVQHVKLPNHSKNSHDEPGRNIPPTRQEILDDYVSINAAPDPHPSWTDAERRSVAFFFDLTVNNIIFVQNDFWFWKETVPCLTEHHAAFRHLIVAIASTHELLYHEDGKTLNAFALTQCNKATKLLRSLQAWQPALLLASCILLSAFSLLRSDLQQAEMTINSGLKMPLSSADSSEIGLAGQQEQIMQVLSRIGKQHGYKLWNPAISYQFERSQATNGALFIETEGVKGPFTQPDQALKAYKNLVIDVITKLMRNIARGAYVDPQCSLAQETVRQFSKFTYYWQCLYSELPVLDEEKRIQLNEIRIVFNIACLLFYTKLANPESGFEVHLGICHDTFQLAEKVLDARRDGRYNKYLDINGAIYTLGFSCHTPELRRRAVALLKGQASGEDGVLSWVRGKLVEIMINMSAQPLRSNVGRERFIITGISCVDNPKSIRLEYQMIFAGGTTHAADFPVEDGSGLPDGVTASEIDHYIQGILVAYRMYAKPDASVAPRGYVREMYYNRRPVPVLWEADESLWEKS